MGLKFYRAKRRKKNPALGVQVEDMMKKWFWTALCVAGGTYVVYRLAKKSDSASPPASPSTPAGTVRPAPTATGGLEARFNVQKDAERLLKGVGGVFDSKRGMGVL